MNRVRTNFRRLAAFIAAIAAIAIAAPASANASANTEWKDGCQITAWQPVQYGSAQAGFKCNRTVFVKLMCARFVKQRDFATDTVVRSECVSDFWLPANTWRYLRVSAQVPYGDYGKFYTHGFGRISSWFAGAAVNSPISYLH